MNQKLRNKEALLDALLVLYNYSKDENSENIQRFIELYEPVYQNELNSRLSIKDFEIVHKDAFARGAFGKVTLVKHKGRIYAMKILNKSYLISQIDRSSPMEEKLILSGSHEWLPYLYCSFQDQKNLYLVMEYAPGGDLQGLMERKQYKFTEQEAQFYIAELVLAVDSLHQLGYMHRDIKPGNILINLEGHIKLADLGSCIAINTKNPLFMVGTMSYVSPEMCNSEGSDPSKGSAYGPESDWWSVGILLYELLYGIPPFTGKDIQIQMKLLDSDFKIQYNDSVSNHANDLISKLLHKSATHRPNITTIKAHPFFKDIEWDTLHTMTKPPFIPILSSSEDLTFFSSTPDEDEDNEDEEDQEDAGFLFIGYTFTENITNSSQFSSFSDRDVLLENYTLKEKENRALEERIRRYERDIEEMTRADNSTQERLNVLESENAIYKNAKPTKENDQLKLRINELENTVTRLEAKEIDTKNLLEGYQQQIMSMKEENNALKNAARIYQKQSEILTLKKQESKKAECNTPAGKSKIISVMWQRDRDSLQHLQKSLETSESQLACARREMVRLKKEVKFYSEQQTKKENIGLEESVYNNKLGKTQLSLSSSVSNLSLLFSKDSTLKPSMSFQGNPSSLQTHIKTEKDFIASSQRILVARSRLSRPKSEFDQELQSSIERSESKIAQLQQKLQQTK